MTTDREALEQSVADNPADPTNRRVLADLYEETGLEEDAQNMRVYANLHERINAILNSHEHYPDVD